MLPINLIFDALGAVKGLGVEKVNCDVAIPILYVFRIDTSLKYCILFSALSP